MRYCISHLITVTDASDHLSWHVMITLACTNVKGWYVLQSFAWNDEPYPLISHSDLTSLSSTLLWKFRRFSRTHTVIDIGYGYGRTVFYDPPPSPLCMITEATGTISQFYTDSKIGISQQHRAPFAWHNCQGCQKWWNPGGIQWTHVRMPSHWWQSRYTWLGGPGNVPHRSPEGALCFVSHQLQHA